MKRPDKKDYETSGSMVNPWGNYDFEAYANELEKYSNYLESKVKNFGIHGVVGQSERLCQCKDASTKHFVKNWCDDCQKHIV